MIRETGNPNIEARDFFRLYQNGESIDSLLATIRPGIQSDPANREYRARVKYHLLQLIEERGEARA